MGNATQRRINFVLKIKRDETSGIKDLLANNGNQKKSQQ
jgi:hypothetical protein